MDKTNEADKGKKILEVLRWVGQFYKEITQFIQTVDNLMSKEGWQPLYSNPVTAGGSSSLDHPEQWFPYMNFRVYFKKDNPDLIKGITLSYDFEKREQPIIIAGTIEKKAKWLRDYDYWVILDLWVTDENQTKKRDGTVYSKFSCTKGKRNCYVDTSIIKKAELFAYNLTDIRNENDIKNKITNKLLELK